MTSMSDRVDTGSAASPTLAELNAAERRMCAAALASLGAGPDQLSSQDREALDRDGFVVFHDVLSRDQVAAINARLDELVADGHRLISERPRNGFPRSVVFEAKENVLKDLVNQGPEFDVAISHPRVMAAIAHVLDGDLKLAYLHMRQPGPGAGDQDMHLDIFEDAVHPVRYFANSIWLLDDFTEDNGTTRFVPGSHRLDISPEQAMPDPYGAHPDQVPILAAAGSVIVFNGHTWHGGTRNYTGGRRRGLFSAWVKRGFYAVDDQRKLIRPETYARLDDARRFLIDVHGAYPIELPDPYMRYLLSLKIGD